MLVTLLLLPLMLHYWFKLPWLKVVIRRGVWLSYSCWHVALCGSSYRRPVVLCFVGLRSCLFMCCTCVLLCSQFPVFALTSVFTDVLRVHGLCFVFVALCFHTSHDKRQPLFTGRGGKPPPGTGKGYLISTCVYDTPLRWSFGGFSIALLFGHFGSRFSFEKFSHPPSPA